MQEVVADVVLSGTGTVNVASLGLYGTFSGFLPFIYPIEGKFLVGSGGNYETYSGATLNPEVFGGGSISNADIKTGDNFGIDGFNNLAVPLGYSGGILNGTSTFTGTTLTTLGANLGTYLVQWGSSGASETITFEVI